MYELPGYDTWKTQTPEEAAGYVEPPTPVCPVCDNETDTFYIYDNEIIGCNDCVRSTDAYDWEAEREVAYA